MVSISKFGDSAIKFTFDDSDHYLMGDGEITVPVNGLILVLDESNMATFKKIDGDPFISFNIANSNFSSKSDLETFYKDNMVGSTGGGGVTSGDVETMISEATSGLSDDISTVSGDVSTLSGAVDSNHNAITALNGNVQTLSGDVANKADTTAVTASINAAVSGKMDTSAFNTYSASTDARISEDEEVTSAALNELNDALDDKADTTAVTASIAAAVSGKQDTLIAGSGITIDSANTISCTVEGGGKAIEAGRGIAITTGATADTVSFDLPIWNPSGAHKNITIGSDTNHPNGMASVAVGQANTTNDRCSFVSGLYNILNNENEAGFGCYNNSHTGSTDADKTAFSVGNGTSTSNRHNAFEIRQNGDIYITKDGSDVKLQDQLGGGGLPESAFTAYTAATESRLAEDEEVTAAALNTLSTALGGFKLVSISQADYDLLPVKDPNTLYIITNVVS